MFKDRNEKITVHAKQKGIAIGKMGNSNIIMQTSKVEEKEGLIKRVIRILLDVWKWFKK